MTINLEQNNRYGNNNSNVTNSERHIAVENTFIVWKSRGEGFLGGIFASIIASLIYDFLIK